MINNPIDELCALSRASFSNLVLTLKRIADLSRELASQVYGDSPSSEQRVADIQLVASAAESGVRVLSQCFGLVQSENSSIGDASDEQDDLGQNLKNILFGIGNGARLISLLEFDTEQHAFSARLALCRQNLALHSDVLRTLFSGLICYDFVEGGPQSCCRKKCLVRKRTASAGPASASREIQWVC
jgi:hypothetical protein